MKNEGADVLNFLSEERSLTSSTLYKIDIYLENKSLLLDLYFEFPSMERIRLRFSEIKEYSFYYNSAYVFYNAEIVKFFKSDESFYISLDPVDESENISPDDNDYILSSKVESVLLM